MADRPVPGPYDLGPFQELVGLGWGGVSLPYPTIVKSVSPLSVSYRVIQDTCQTTNINFFGEDDNQIYTLALQIQEGNDNQWKPGITIPDLRGATITGRTSGATVTASDFDPMTLDCIGSIFETDRGGVSLTSGTDVAWTRIFQPVTVATLSSWNWYGNSALGYDTAIWNAFIANEECEVTWL